MYDLYFLIGYNNYYNRRLKKHNTLQEYLTHVQDHYVKLDGCLNFNPADGVNTTHVLNDLANYNILADIPNYMLVCDPDTNQILQRWFVIDCDRTRGGQYQCTLHRDILIDAYNSWTQSPVFVEKAILNKNDSAIFNRENMTFSQIKKETDDLIADLTGMPWIVGYGNFKNITDVTTWGAGSSTTPTHAEEVNINAYRIEYGPTVTQVVSYDKIYLDTAMADGTNSRKMTYSYKNNNINYGLSNLTSTEYSQLLATSYNTVVAPGTAGFTQLVTNLKSSFTSAMSGANGFEQTFNFLKTSVTQNVNKYLAINNKYFKDTSTGKYYKAITTVTPHNAKTRLYSDSYSTLYSCIRNAPDGIAGLLLNPNNDRSNAYFFDLSANEYKVEFQLLGENGGTVDLRSPTELNDAPYSMFFLPFGDNKIKINGQFKNWGNKTSNLEAVTGIAQALKEVGYIYDIQILPYCPVQGDNLIFYNVSGKRGYTIDSSTFDYRLVKDGNNNDLTYLVFANSSSGSFEPGLYLDDTYGYNKKLEYETKKYRLVSPNQNSIFEFSPQMIADYVSFDVQFTYKPYSPYIHVAPKFDGMYGLNQPQDQRGLICSGDFSIDMVNDDWAAYQLQNVNYQRAFDREIENLEIQQKYGKIGDIAGAISGTLGAAGTGAAVGSAAGPGGAAIGAAIAGAASAGAGVADVYINDKLRNETLDLKNDMFGYAMGNIQARPLTISKVSGFNTNSRYMPYLETYSCTTEEYEALKNKITYNGETVMRIDKPINFFGNRFYTSPASYNTHNYFKGQLIQCDIASEDFHFINAMADELNKGIYVPIGGI